MYVQGLTKGCSRRRFFSSSLFSVNSDAINRGSLFKARFLSILFLESEGVDQTRPTQKEMLLWVTAPGSERGWERLVRLMHAWVNGRMGG